MRFRDDETFTLTNESAHIWTVSEEIQTQAIKAQSVLSMDELDRAQKFRFIEDKNTYITGRVVLRVLLSRYIREEPRRIIFDYNSQGKPYVQDSVFQFNLSNSKSKIAIGITKRSLIGIDIEFNKRPVEVSKLALNFFSDKEIDKLMGLPVADRLSAFYECWTRKEAFIKANGGGLTIPLDAFEVSFLSREDPKILRIAWDKNHTSQWSVHSFTVDKRFTGAAVVQKKCCEFKEMAFNESFPSDG